MLSGRRQRRMSSHRTLLRTTFVLLLVIIMQVCGQPSPTATAGNRSTAVPSKMPIFVPACATYTTEASCVTSSADVSSSSPSQSCGWCSPTSTFYSGSACCINAPPDSRSGQACSCSSSVNIFSVTLLLAGSIALIMCIGMLVRRCVLRQRLHLGGGPRQSEVSSQHPDGRGGGAADWDNPPTGVVVALSSIHARRPMTASLRTAAGDEMQPCQPGAACGAPESLPSYYAPPTQQGYQETPAAAVLVLGNPSADADPGNQCAATVAEAAQQRQLEGEEEALCPSEQQGTTL